MWSKRKFECMKRKISKLERELADSKAQNVAMSSELQLMKKKYEAEVAVVEKMKFEHSTSYERYAKEIESVVSLRHEYETLIKDCMSVKKEYETKMKKLLSHAKGGM